MLDFKFFVKYEGKHKRIRRNVIPHIFPWTEPNQNEDGFVAMMDVDPDCNNGMQSWSQKTERSVQCEMYNLHLIYFKYENFKHFFGDIKVIKILKYIFL